MGLSGCCRRRRSPQNPPQHPQADEVELPPLPPQQNDLPGQLAVIPHPKTAPIEVNIDFDLKKTVLIKNFCTAATNGTGRGSNANSHGPRIFERSGPIYGWLEKTSIANFHLSLKLAWFISIVCLVSHAMSHAMTLVSLLMSAPLFLSRFCFCLPRFFYINNPVPSQ